MKIMTNNIDLFKRLNDIIPTIDIDISKIFGKEYIIDSDNKYVLSDGTKLGTYFSKVEDLYELLKSITNDRVNEVFIEYISKSGIKTLSCLFELLLMTYGTQKISDYYTISKRGIVDVLNLIYSRYYKKWSNLLELLNTKYEPLKPYDMTIKESDTNELTSKNENEAHLTNDNTENKSYVFNSTEAVPTDISDRTTDTNAKTDYTRSSTGGRDVTRQGNIGNITQQELILKQREVLEYQIIDTIYKDLDRVLTRSKYI